jgi:hypothetical protein
MNITPDEQAAIRTLLDLGQRFGYGNMISHLQTAWARMLMREHGVSEHVAREASGGRGYPFTMQDDLVERGMWDELGEAYRR